MTRDFFLTAAGASPDTHHCSMCGEPHWTACWLGAGEIFLCRTCALQNLAGLFVDATGCPAWTHVADFERVLETFTTRFYRAVALVFSPRTHG